MKCGHCKLDHGTVEEVRQCAGAPVETLAGDQYAVVSRKELAGVGGRPTKPMSPSDMRHAASREEKIADVELLRAAVDEGWYAVFADNAIDVEFYRIDKPQTGRWAGYTFLKQQAGDELHPAKGLDRQIRVLSQIAADPKACAIRYGKKIGRCGVCNRTLTNKDSIALGIGPVCAEKRGW